MRQVRALGDIARQRGQNLAQMALAWVLRQDTMASALIGASRVEQIDQNVGALQNLVFSEEEQKRIDQILQ
jgi:L-glyceraldehyde 3-phosphate reductase